MQRNQGCCEQVWAKKHWCRGLSAALGQDFCVRIVDQTTLTRLLHLALHGHVLVQMLFLHVGIS